MTEIKNQERLSDKKVSFKKGFRGDQLTWLPHFNEFKLYANRSSGLRQRAPPKTIFDINAGGNLLVSMNAR